MMHEVNLQYLQSAAEDSVPAMCLIYILCVGDILQLMYGDVEGGATLRI